MIVTKLTVINLNPFSDLYFSSQISVNQPLMTKKKQKQPSVCCLLLKSGVWATAKTDADFDLTQIWKEDKNNAVC